MIYKSLCTRSSAWFLNTEKFSLKVSSFYTPALSVSVSISVYVCGLTQYKTMAIKRALCFLPDKCSFFICALFVLRLKSVTQRTEVPLRYPMKTQSLPVAH